MERSLKKIIKETKLRDLKWKVKDCHLPGEFDLNIRTDPIEKIHYINIPQIKRSPIRDSDYLHELCHAYLAEKVHHMFATKRFRPGWTQEQLDTLRPATYAVEWWVDYRMFQLAPEIFKKEVLEHYNAFFESSLVNQNEISATDFIMAAFTIAQAIYYCGTENPTEGRLATAVDAYLSYDPANPNLNDLTELTNRLASIYTLYRVRLMPHEEFGECWEIIKIE